MSGMQYNPGGRPPEERKQQMEKRFIGPSLLIVTVMGCLLLTLNARTAPSYPQSPTPVSESYVQVTSVTVEPSTVHKTQNPNTVTIIAQILLSGEAPPSPEAIVEVGTASSDPPNNELRYENPTRTVPLKKGVTVVKFKAETVPTSFQGKIKVAVTLGGATRGVATKCSEPRDYSAELTVTDP